MCKALNNLGFRVTLFIRSESKDCKKFIFDNYEINPELINIVETTPLLKRGTELFIALKSLTRYLLLNSLEKNSILIISRNIFAAYFLSFFHKKKLIYETHILETGIIRKLIQKFLLKKDNINTVVISEALKKILLSNYNSKSSNIKVCHDAAFDGGSPLTHDIKIIKRKNFFSNFKKDSNFSHIVGYFGHLYPGRGIEIIQKLAEKKSDILFLVFGGQEEDILKYKKDNKLSNLIFMGHLSPKNVKFAMSMMDVLLMPYQKSVSVSLKSVNTASWMSPIKMFEYMSVGVPIISSDLQVLREVLVDKHNSLLVKPDEIIEWLNALNLLIKDKNLAASIGSNAYKEFINRYTWEIRAKKMLDDLIINTE
jgi:glycosyltransferase involved in cell wall biosynthesis